jgi:hypothetical protein
LNCAEPVTLVRSPTLTKLISGESTQGSSPDRRVYGGSFAGTRGGTPATACAIARMCAGVVPQQPPTRLSRPARANSPSISAISAGPSS